MGSTRCMVELAPIKGVVTNLLVLTYPTHCPTPLTPPPFLWPDICLSNLWLLDNQFKVQCTKKRICMLSNKLHVVHLCCTHHEEYLPALWYSVVHSTLCVVVYLVVQLRKLWMSMYSLNMYSVVYLSHRNIRPEDSVVECTNIHSVYEHCFLSDPAHH